MIGTTGIWSDDEARPENYPHSELLCFKLIFRVFVKSIYVLDFGCGDGYYLDKMWDAGFRKVAGVDGNATAYNRLMHTADLSEPFSFGRKGQVLSLEVGEHIPREYEQQFIDNLCHDCNTRLVISWAIEGQQGIGHVNCRNNDYVIEQIERRGFRFNGPLSHYLRADIEQGVSYFKKSLMVFDRRALNH